VTTNIAKVPVGIIIIVVVVVRASKKFTIASLRVANDNVATVDKRADLKISTASCSITRALKEMMKSIGGDVIATRFSVSKLASFAAHFIS
jgi:hypothetical protein